MCNKKYVWKVHVSMECFFFFFCCNLIHHLTLAEYCLQQRFYLQLVNALALGLVLRIYHGDGFGFEAQTVLDG